jgi:hypothetical protein
VPPIDIWPIPFNPQYAFNNDLKISGLLLNDSVSFYTVSGELVAKVTQNSSGGALVTWDGKNKNNRLSSSGIYYYLIQRGGKVLMRGKLLIINGN